jgi:hypothetical protein
VSTVAHVCRKKLKVPASIFRSYFCIVLLIWRVGGGARAHAANGGVSGDPASNFYARFGARRAIRRGGGGHMPTSPLPPGCNHHRDIHPARPCRIKHLKSKPVFYARIGRTTSDPTRGRGTGDTNPLPPGCDHHRNALHARFIRTEHLSFH